MSDEDKATVVIDFNSLKDSLKDEEKLIDDNELDLEFGTSNDDDLKALFDDIEDLDDQSIDSTPPKKAIYLFEYNSQFFTSNLAQHQSNESTKLISDLKSLNEVLGTTEECIVVFYYNEHPKVVNQLCLQIKQKFNNAKTLIIAKNLSPQKAQQHSQTKYAAHSYLSYPFDIKEFYQTIHRLESNKI